ncbi:hypothetical protein K435DRAFT_801703 [Dendrothele bispora CBS 962.96]|uniref:Uncharacterized protein n=1 Tax=Dendrothele bispora (strain CBS 962.96) TaxID=1314807 RepID=A0A4V4HEE8_DENBC|nr:hypothetical protein K435DRAFT_801703 [Dendrothele bispora CBS 962.96]
MSDVDGKGLMVGREEEELRTLARIAEETHNLFDSYGIYCKSEAIMKIAFTGTAQFDKFKAFDVGKSSKELMQDTAISAISAHPESNQLRQEVEGLRREMHDLRIQVGGYESPPSYRSLSPTLMIGGERLRTSNIFGPAPTSVMIGD